jgi:2-polyprenyl-6-hydroxyphenyl methylase/3-demethylubiquinone-9 3-methyltransferase
MRTAYSEYGFDSADAPHTARYLLPPILELAGELPAGTRVLDVGCGNGYFLGQFLRRGCVGVGIDLSETGIAIARDAYPQARFEVLAADDALLDSLREAPFDIVLSTEVVEHLYDPRAYARGCLTALKPGGRFICSTPYHGYLKNLVIAAAGKWDSHASPLWDGGHIKLWSRESLSTLFVETGFQNLQFRGAGRLPFLWMSMVLSGDKPAAPAGAAR